MAKEFTTAAAKPTGSGGKRHGMPPMLTGIIIGLLLGIMLALGVATWLNRAHIPFLDKSPPVEALPTIAARPVLPPVTKSDKGELEKPRFEFYQILPGDKGGKDNSSAERAAVGAANSAKPTSNAEQRPAAKPDAVSTKEAAKSASTETVYLQAGAFQSQTDAENLKAKIAFSGFEANVRPVNLPDKGTLYRVRLGPYKSADEVNRIKTTLSQNGIAAAVVKAGD
jgi:cell division protein FtsN